MGAPRQPPPRSGGPSWGAQDREREKRRREGKSYVSYDAAGDWGAADDKVDPQQERQKFYDSIMQKAIKRRNEKAERLRREKVQEDFRTGRSRKRDDTDLYLRSLARMASERKLRQTRGGQTAFAPARKASP